MRYVLGLLLLLGCAASAVAQVPADSLVMSSPSSHVWNDGQTSVVELTGPVKIEVTRATLSADSAVVWVTPVAGGGSHRVEIALVGHASLSREGKVRTDQRLMVQSTVGGSVRLNGQRVAVADTTSDLYQTAVKMRGLPKPGPTPSAVVPPTDGVSRLPTLTEIAAATNPTTRAAVAATAAAVKPVQSTGRSLAFESGRVERAVTADGAIAEVCGDGVSLRYVDEKQNLIEFVAHDMVLFTNLTDLKTLDHAGGAKDFFADHIVSAYFDGDVQVYMTPAAASHNELRLRAERVYYEFATDRAVMTDVLFHTVDVKKQIPVFMRAVKLKQLSVGEFQVDGLTLSSSSFFTPTYNLSASHAYVRADNSGDPRLGERVAFNASDVTLDAFGVPIFYFPGMSGTMTAKGSAFRGVGFEDSNRYGVGLHTDWGLFETFNLTPPKDLDASYRLDYYSKRGPAGGIDAKYDGGFVSETTRQPWNFEGDVHAYFVDDRGVDILGSARADEPASQQFRGRAYFEHQYFLPDDWQAQIRLGYVSDSNFNAEWFNDEYNNGLPDNESLYLKHQKNSELYSVLVEAQPNRSISIADEEQENREVSRLPELKYDRVGDSLLGDSATFFSEDSASALKFVRNTQSLTQQGFYPGVEPGLPAYAYTGDPGRTTFRGDFRQELDFPINAGPLKVVPYVVGRYTGYNQGVVPPNRPGMFKTVPTDVSVSSDQNRLIGATGVRLTTDFWKVDDSVQSDVFDLHRLRHIVEPELNVFASSSNVDQDRLFIYDPEVDAANDVEAMQLVLRQRWQTKRGGPGRWRSVDFFTLNVSANLFNNQPQNRFRDPVDFRGLYFTGRPESSLPRNSINADAQWRLSDSTAVLSDVSENMDRKKLATASVGLAAQRDQRLSYFLGTRYISDLNSNIATVEANYQLDRKYSLTASESIDLAQSKNVTYNFSLVRSFDNFSASLRVFYDQSTNDKGVSFTLQPFGLARTVGSGALTNPQQ